MTSVSSRLTNNVSRGQLQLLQKEAGTFCGMTVVFCKKLNWHLLASCLEDFSGRLSFGARKDILPLVRICPEVTAIRAREFVKDGIKTAEELADTDIRRVTQLLMDAMPHSNVNSGNKKSNSPTGDATSNETNSKPSVTRENIVALKDNGREAQRALCERLAKLILSKAKQHVRDEDKHRFKSILS